MTDIDNEMWRIRYAEEIFPSEMSTIGQHLADEIERLRAENADLAMIIERLGKPVVNAYRWEDVKRFTDAEAKLVEIEAEMNAYANAYAEANKRLAAAEAEIEFMRAWCADHFGGLVPPTREQNIAFMRALDEMENNRD